MGFFSKQPQEKCIKELRKAAESNSIIIAINGLLSGVPDDLQRLVPILNQLYGGKHWIDRTVIAVTRGNEVKKLGYDIEARQKAWHSGSESIPASLERSGMTPEEANSIPIIWAYGKDDKHWQRLLLLNAIERAKGGKGAIVMINEDLINDAQKERLISKTTKEVVDIIKKKGGTASTFFKKVVTTTTKVFEVKNPQQIEIEQEYY